MSTNTEFVGVLRMADYFLAVHFREGTTYSVSKHLASDIRIAQAAAQAFAEKNHLPYDPTMLYEADRPSYTVIKQDSKWYPAEIHPDRVTLLTHFGKKKHKNDIGHEDVNFAIAITQGIAAAKHADFDPSIGISLEKNNDPIP